MKFEDMKGMTLSRVDVADDKQSITFGTTDGRLFRQHHRQDCCESVDVEDVVGDVSDLLGEPLLLAEEVTYSGDDYGPENEWPEEVAKPERMPESYTWTFYKLATINGSVTIRWLGESNGYYSESVDFSEVEA